MKTKSKKMIHLFVFAMLYCLILSVSVRSQELIGWWKLDDGSGTVAKDSSGQGNDGIINNPIGGLGQGGNVWINDPERGMVASFNGAGGAGARGARGGMAAAGTGAYISCGTGNIIPAMTLTNDFTWAFWAKQGSNTSANAPIIGNRNGGTQNPIQFIKFTPTQFEYYSGGQIGGPRQGQAAPQGTAEEAAINYPDLTAVDGWLHHAVVKEGTSLTYYRNGSLTLTATVSETVDSNPFFIGGDGSANEYWAGYISDVRLYNKALTEEEIQKVKDSIDSDQIMQSIFNAFKEAEANIEEKDYQRAISLIGKTISEYEESKQQAPENITSANNTYICELNYLLALAKEAVGKPKEEIAAAYRQILQSDTIYNKSLMQKQGSALLWLYQNSNPDYKTEVNSLLNHNSNYLKAVAAKSEIMISEQQATTAIKFLEHNIASYTQWQKEHPFDEVVSEDTLPEIYFQLARAKEAANLTKKDIAKAYSNTFVPSQNGYVSRRTDALIWLVENECTEELSRAIELFTQEKDIEASYNSVFSSTCEYFESKKDGNGFKLLLDTLFTTAKYPAEWAMLVESCIADKSSRWAQVYYSSLEDKPRLKFGVDCILAEQYVTEEKYKEATDLYADILTRCEPEDDKGELEFKLCQCLFDGGFYNEAITKINDFISGSYKGTHRSSVKAAMLMKGRALIQLAEIDKAINTFSEVMIEYPETTELPETTFFVGYCYMLQGKFNQATEAFKIVTKEYSDSSYANQASLCLIRIKDMSE